MPKITLKKDGEVIQIFRLEAKNLRVGSDRLADVFIEDWTVGKEEALIWPKGNGFLIKGAGAFPQVVVNGSEISGERLLSDGDEIKIGPYSLVFARLPEELAGYVPQPEPAPVEPATGKILEARQAAVVSQPQPSLATPQPAPTPLLRPEPVHDPASEKTMIASIPERTKISETYEAPAGTGEYYLLAVWGPMAGRRFGLKPGETKIGRDKEANQIVVREDEQGELDTSVSRRHASLFWSHLFIPGGEGAEFSIIDVGSKSGVMVNGKKIKPEKGVPVKVGDEIGIISEKDSSIFRLASGARLDFAPPRFGKAPQKIPFYAQKNFWIIGGIIILLLFLVWLILK